MTTDQITAREAVVAGQFYPAAPQRLQAMINEAVPDSVAAESHGKVRALIVPHAGYQFSGRVAGEAYALLHGRTDIKRVMVLAPAHRVPFGAISVGSFTAFQTPLGDIPVDADACQVLLESSSLVADRNDAHEFEHALEVQLPFLQSVLGDFKLVPIVCGQLSRPDESAIAAVLADHLWDPETLWVISSDFTHYGSSFGYTPFRDNIPERLRELDRGAIDRICTLDVKGFQRYLDDTGATICGSTPIGLLLSAVNSVSEDVTAEEVMYSTSGEITGDHRQSVSYASIAFYSSPAPRPGAAKADVETEFSLEENDQSRLMELARESIRAKLQSESPPTPDAESLNPVLREKACAFVTLHLQGRLRGCIGSLEPREALYKNVINNARNAAFSDPRFPPLSASEFEDIEIEISVLTPARPIGSPEDFIPGQHGIILKKGRAKAVFLPQVASEQGWDRETTLTHLALKAGLEPDGWRRGAKFEVFEAIVFGAE
ncbi:MAG: AmmeMemoRadiSam system protein B [Lentisphaeria bacterium]